MNIILNPIPVSREVIDKLNAIGVISSRRPGENILDVKKGESKHETIYSCDNKFGPHKLICVTINSTEAKNFLYHNDAEDFMLIDHTDRTELIITMCLIKKDELNLKIRNKTFSKEDMISVIFKPNDPYLSFFTMNKEYAHVETCMFESDKPPSFYVAESRDLDENLIDLKEYKLIIERG